MIRQPVVPVILSGGAGTRLWPLSREHHPKQLIALAGEHTLLQATARRLASIGGAGPPIVVCNETHRFMVAEQLRAVGVTPSAIVLEAAGRSTAPAVAAAALEALEALVRCTGSEEPVLLVLPADHVIGNHHRFAQAVRAGVEEAASGKLVLFGVAPSHAETGYGYIRAGAAAGVSGVARAVDGFVEKPDAQRAADFIASDHHFWNSGMFVFGAARYLEELNRHAPAVRAAVEGAHARAVRDLDFLRLDAASFARSPAVSVDHAMMERTSSAVMVPLDADWSDVGSWTALAQLAEGDAAGNVVHGDVLLEQSRSTFVRGHDRLVAVVGMEQCVVVDTADAVLVAGKHAIGDVGRIVTELKRTARAEALHHRRLHRPWGSFDTVHTGEGFKVKHLLINPGERLSLQSHRHRAEHWIVVRGVAWVTRGDATFALGENESTFIPAGVTHRLENRETTPLDLIEVQSGPYLGEDDIVRFDDAYGRAGRAGGRDEAPG